MFRAIAGSLLLGSSALWALTLDVRELEVTDCFVEQSVQIRYFVNESNQLCEEEGGGEFVLDDTLFWVRDGKLFASGSGDILGSIVDASGERQLALYSEIDGYSTRLDISSQFTLIPEGLNDHGWTIASYQDREGITHGILWTPETGAKYLAQFRPTAINNLGIIAGTNGTTALIWEDGQLSDLSEALQGSTSTSIVVITEVISIDDDNRMIARGFTAAGEQQMVRVAQRSDTTLDDPLRYLVTLNSHGSRMDEAFTLPSNVDVMVPHPSGLDTPYLLLSPPGGQTFEEMLYTDGEGEIPVPSSGGWHVYKSGEKMQNMLLCPWSGSDETQQEYDKWSKWVPKADLSYVKRDAQGRWPKFAIVPARDSEKQMLAHRGQPKFKVKVFGHTTLKSVLQELKRQYPAQPIVFAPLACNYQANVENESVSIGGGSTSDIRSLFNP